MALPKRIAKLIERMEAGTEIRFHELCQVCDYFFGEPRQRGTSHRVYRTPWQGDPRVNIQNNRGRAHRYQVRQVLRAVERVQAERAAEEAATESKE